MARLTESDVVKLIDSLSNWGRWGADDELGTINHITPAVRRRAAALVRDGVPVTCARPIVTNDIAVDTTIQPAARGSEVPAGAGVMPEDLEAAERAQGVRVQEGDILLVRTGLARRLHELGPWDTTTAKAGLHPTAMPFISERHVAALGSDGNSDTAPSSTEGVAFPIHVLALNAMGVHLLDYLQFEDLVAHCEDAGRWEFLFAAAPLRIQDGTGSPLNPVAVF